MTGLGGPNAVAGLGGPNAVAGLGGPNAVAGLRGPNAVAGLGGPNAVAGLGGPNAVAGLGGPNAVAGLGGPNAVAGLGGPNAVTREHVLVLAKAPVAGQAKTRLCPPCSPVEAATVAEAALADTLDAVARCGAARKVIALDGEPGEWLPEGFEVLPQRGGGLAQRLAAAWFDTGGPGVQIGMDTPQVGPDDLDRLLDLATAHPRRAVLGPALDGGWWVIGLPVCDPNPVFAGIPMSSARTGFYQLLRLRRLGFDVTLAETRRDIDTAGDLVAVATEAPHTRTAAAACRLRLADGVG